jgi:hypothetical protein
VTTAATERTCPQCGASVQVVSGFPDWCEQCGWNLQPPPGRDAPEGRFGRLMERVGRRSGDRMARELLTAGSLSRG